MAALASSHQQEDETATQSSLFKEYREDLMTYLGHVRNEIKEVLQDETYLVKMFTDGNSSDKEHEDAQDDTGNFVIEHSDTFRRGELALYLEKMYNEFDLNHDEKLGKDEVCNFLVAFLKLSRGHSVNQIRAELDEDVRKAMEAWRKVKVKEDPTFQGDLEAAVDRFWKSQLPIFKNVIHTHHYNMIEEKKELTEELMDLMDENHDGHVSKREFLHTFTRAMEEVIPTHLFTNIENDIIEQFDYHSKPSMATVIYHMQVKHFKTLQDNIFAKFQSEKLKYSDNDVDGVDANTAKSKPSYQTWRLLSTNDLRAFKITLEQSMTTHGNVLSEKWLKLLRSLGTNSFTVEQLLGKAGVDAVFSKVNELAYEANTKASTSLSVIFDDFDREFFKSAHGLHLTEIEDLLKCYLKQFGQFAFIVFLAVLEPMLRKRIRNLPYVGEEFENKITHPYDRYIVYAIFYHIGDKWKEAFSSYYESLCSNDKIEGIARKLFIILDTNKDGVVQKHEFIKGFGRGVHKTVAGVGTNIYLRNQLIKKMTTDLTEVLNQMKDKLTTNFHVPPQNALLADFERLLKNGYKDRVINVLKDNPSLAEKKFQSNATPLHFAVENYCGDIVDYLLAMKNVDVNAQTKFKVTPLHKAAMKGYKNILKALLNDGANINAQDELGNTPLHYAIAHGNSPIIETLLAKSQIDVTLSNSDGYDAHDLCIQHHQVSIASYIQKMQ